MEEDLKKGKILLGILISFLIVTDLLLKSYLVYVGTIRSSQIVGTIVLIFTCYYLWKGSRFAYFFLLSGIILGAVYLIYMINKIPIILAFILSVYLLIVFILMLIPSTRNYLRNKNFNKTII